MREFLTKYSRKLKTTRGIENLLKTFISLEYKDCGGNSSALNTSTVLNAST